MRVSYASCWRRLVASLTACALIVMSTGCATKRVHITASAPPPPESEALIVGATTKSGQVLRFSEPAAIEARDTEDPILTGRVITDYQGQPADEAFQLELSAIAEYQLATEERKVDALGIVVILALIIFLAASSFGDMSGAS